MLAFAWATLKVLHRFVREYATVFVLAEIQNPELIVHLHSVFARCIHQKPFSFTIDDKAMERVKKFQEHTPQLNAINPFCSQGKASLFYHNERSSLVTRWLLQNGIDLAKNHALVTLIELNKTRLFGAQLLIVLRFLTYPRCKVHYLAKLRDFMGATSCHQ